MDPIPTNYFTAKVLLIILNFLTAVRHIKEFISLKISYITLNTFIFHFQSSQWTQCLLNVIANPDYEIVLRGVVIFTVSCLKYIYFLFFQTVLSHLNNLGRFVDKNIVSDHFSKNSELFSNKKN
jgi:hypothetical protein